MASLVAPLVSGVSTAASGSVEFYKTGTSEAADVYSDNAGAVKVTSHTLDARGAIVRYVDARVDVVVKNTNGGTVVSFTWGTDAREARLENAGFTGPDATGQTKAGGQTTVDAAFTSIFNSLGATDGKVLVNGAAQTISAAIASGAGLFYNIKDGYGAAGNGVTDDAAAFQAMINAAEAAGGGILYFPAGTYLINSAVTITASKGKFLFLGAGAAGTIIRQGTSGIDLLTLGDSNDQVLIGLKFDASSAANTGTLIKAGTSGRTLFLGCAFDVLDGTSLEHVVGSDSTLVHSKIDIAGSNAEFGNADAGGGTYRLIGCEVTIGASALGFFDVSAHLTACKVELTAASGSLASGSGQTYEITGGQIENSGAGALTLVSAGTAILTGVKLLNSGGGSLAVANTSPDVFESGCDGLDSGGITLGGKSSTSRSTTRDHRVTSTSGSATSYTPSGDVMVHHLTSSGASMTINNPSPDVFTGSGLLILYKNTSGGNITPTFGSSYSFVTAVAQVNNNQTGVYYFVQRGFGITSDLVCISPQPVGGTAL